MSWTSLNFARMIVALVVLALGSLGAYAQVESRCPVPLGWDGRPVTRHMPRRRRRLAGLQGDAHRAREGADRIQEQDPPWRVFGRRIERRAYQERGACLA